MIEKLGKRFTSFFIKFMPDAFVFALLLTVIMSIVSMVWVGSKPIDVVQSWYKGFFDLIGFAMQIVLLIVTGYSIALSPFVNRAIDKLATYIKTPTAVYFFVVLIGGLLSLVSFGWIVITAVLARELAQRVKGINYPFLVACTYFSMNSWVFGLSSSIPLLLNTEKNFLIEAGLLDEVIPTAFTLQSSLNIAMLVLVVLLAPILFMFLRPKSAEGKELNDLTVNESMGENQTIKEEAEELKLPFNAISDTLNNSWLLQAIIVLMGLTVIIHHFTTKGFDLNFSIMIFTFLIVGMLLHQTPMRYVISMKRASSNISGIIFQYPFYAGIMGIMLYTGLGTKLGEVLASIATVETYPFFAYLTGGVVNFAIPSAGGEFAVIGPSMLGAVKELGAGLPQSELNAMISRASLSVAYGESLSNMMQPFYLLVVFPVMGKGLKLQARDVMGYLVIPFLVFFVLQSLLVVFWPM